MVLSFSYFYIFIHFAHFVPQRDYRETLGLVTYYRGRVPDENPGEVLVKVQPSVCSFIATEALRHSSSGNRVFFPPVSVAANTQFALSDLELNYRLFCFPHLFSFSLPSDLIIGTCSFIIWLIYFFQHMNAFCRF